MVCSFPLSFPQDIVPPHPHTSPGWSFVAVAPPWSQHGCSSFLTLVPSLSRLLPGGRPSASLPSAPARSTLRARAFRHDPSSHALPTVEAPPSGVARAPPRAPAAVPQQARLINERGKQGEGGRRKKRCRFLSMTCGDPLVRDGCLSKSRIS
jgi:hypothetical protein